MPYKDTSKNRACAKRYKERKRRALGIRPRRKFHSDEEKRDARRAWANKTYLRSVKRNPVHRALLVKKAYAKRRGVKFNLNEEWYLAHYSQGCAATGRDLDVPGSGGIKGNPWSPEIDRIEPGGDYTMDNCRIVCAIYNRMRMCWGDAPIKEFIELLK